MDVHKQIFVGAFGSWLAPGYLMNPYLKAQAEASKTVNAIAQARLDLEHPNRQPCIGDAAWTKEEAAMWAQLFKDKK